MTTTSDTRLGIRKLTARIGAEITGLGPGLELDPDAVAAVRAALNEHKALVFRGINPDDEGQQRFAGYFGALTTAHPTVPAIDGAPKNILRVSWEPAQLVLFDNRITQHYAIDNYDDAPRRLHCVTVAGDIPVGIDGKQSYSLMGDASHYTPVADGRSEA